MAYITREDGERFVIPSYRDVLRTTSKSLLKREILLLSANYGEFITLQKKGSQQYEAAFSNDAGYLLGESIWNYFKRPADMVFCEAIPNTNEALLVIVKAGSVYLDGSFPIDSIPEELVIFKTQENNFEIYISGDVPIGQVAEEGKFTFDATSVKSFTVLDQPAFLKIPLYRIYKLQLVDQVLKSQRIGTFPLRQIVLGMIIIALAWFGFKYLLTSEEGIPSNFIAPANPYQFYVQELTSPDPAQILHELSKNFTALLAIPGWLPQSATYANGQLVVQVKSFNTKTPVLYEWADKNQAAINITAEGFFVNKTILLPNRAAPTSVYKLQEVIAALVDRLLYILPGNTMKLKSFTAKNKVTQLDIEIDFILRPPITFDSIAKEFEGLPIVLQNINMRIDLQGISGTISLQAFGV